VLSWILRHRSRLTVIYGAAPTPPLAGERFASARPATAGEPEAPQAPSRPGVLRRRAGGELELRPMPRRVA
jgi:hypothetical protein